MSKSPTFSKFPELPLDIQRRIVEASVKNVTDQKELAHLKTTNAMFRDTMNRMNVKAAEVNHMISIIVKGNNILTKEDRNSIYVNFAVKANGIIWMGDLLVNKRTQRIEDVFVGKAQRNPDNRRIVEVIAASRWPGANVVPSWIIAFAAAAHQALPHIVTQPMLQIFLEGEPAPSRKSASKSKSPKPNLLTNYQDMSGVLGHKEATEKFLRKNKSKSASNSGSVYYSV